MVSTTHQYIQKLASLVQEMGLRVGSRLPAERKLCELLSVSRSTLRELLKQLNAQGMIETKIGSGSFIAVSPIFWLENDSSTRLSQLLDEDPNYRFDVQETRAILEAGAAKYAAWRATPEDQERIRQAYEQLLHYQSIGEAELAADADAYFHLAIAEASQNAVLIQMMKDVFGLLHHNVVLGRRKMYSDSQRFEKLNDQHEAILHAIIHQQADFAQEAMYEHIHYVIQEVKSIDEAEARHLRKNRLNKP